MAVSIIPFLPYFVDEPVKNGVAWAYAKQVLYELMNCDCRIIQSETNHPFNIYSSQRMLKLEQKSQVEFFMTGIGRVFVSSPATKNSFEKKGQQALFYLLSESCISPSPRIDATVNSNISLGLMQTMYLKHNI